MGSDPPAVIPGDPSDPGLAYADSDLVHRLLPYPALVEALAAGHRRPEAEVRRVVFSPPGSDQVFLALPAWQPDESIGVKLVTVFPGNLDRGLPSVQAVYVLFDGADGRPRAILDGTALTYRKTAADSALGSRFLSRPDASTLLMVGSGGLAPHLIAAHRAVRPGIERVLVWNRTTDRAEQLAAGITGAVVEVVDDLPQAVARADVISTATMAPQPLVRGGWLRAGTHLDLVGAFRPDTREVDDEVVRRASIYVDSRLAALEECGDLVIPLRSGVITLEDIRGDLFGLCRGEVEGRRHPEEITLFENGGGGHLDLMTAGFLWSRLQGD